MKTYSLWLEDEQGNRYPAFESSDTLTPSVDVIAINHRKHPLDKLNCYRMSIDTVKRDYEKVPNQPGMRRTKLDSPRLVKIIPNATGQEVRVLSPWSNNGEPPKYMVGAKDCFFCVQYVRYYDDLVERPKYRYPISANDMTDYRKAIEALGEDWMRDHGLS